MSPRYCPRKNTAAKCSSRGELASTAWETRAALRSSHFLRRLTLPLRKQLEEPRHIGHHLSSLLRGACLPGAVAPKGNRLLDNVLPLVPLHPVPLLSPKRCLEPRLLRLLRVYGYSVSEEG